MRSAALGSPPLAWGKAIPGFPLKTSNGITPTCVGKRRVPCESSSGIWDHPHLRGEKPFMCPQCSQMPGSPPLAWGKAEGQSPYSRFQGITPTCVGKSCRGAVRPRRSRDHPHLRGEKGKIAQKTRRRPGSPPLAWGKVFCIFYAIFGIGSPPLTWGKAEFCDWCKVSGRITPTYVGKSNA